MTRAVLLAVPLLVGAALPAVPASRPLPAAAARGAAPGAQLAPRALRQLVFQRVEKGDTLRRLVPRRPVLGGQWSVASPEDVRFAAPGIVAIDYEDGHLAGRLVVQVVDPNAPRTWVVLEDRER